MSIVIINVGKNKITQLADSSEKLISPQSVVQSWEDSISFCKADETKFGLRSAQLGALFAIKSHWTVTKDSATVVMPTGTGKTETMIATVVSELIEKALVVVPSKLLRDQTFEKFKTLGVLREIGVVSQSAINPAVTALITTPTNVSELEELIEKSNILIATMSLLQKFPDSFLKIIGVKCNNLIVDEAHHIAAKQWARVKSKLGELKCLQFTATPFRNDTKKIDGKIIYNFPLRLAQEQGYFQKINYYPLHEFDVAKGDLAIASAAIDQLRKDTALNYNHIILVRSKNKISATNLYNSIYKKYYAQYNPVLIYSGLPAKDIKDSMDSIKCGKSKIVVCVDMFGEGIDIPNLKIAAIHDKYKSLPITLQFVGRFARSSANLGPATVITNIANDDLNDSLHELYAQDSDWNILLHEKSTDKIDKELSLQQLVKGFNSSNVHGLAVQQLRPKISMVAYRIGEKKWNLSGLYKQFNQDKNFITINDENRVIVIIEKVDSKVAWTSFKGVNDTIWQLHLIYWNKDKNLLFVNSTEKKVSDSIAKALFLNPIRVVGETVFRCLHGIKRLMLATVGLRSGIDGPIRYRMFAGIDVASGIAESQKTTSFKSNLFGSGYNGNGLTSIGCSHKGIIWSRWVESIDFWMDWCNEVASRLQDDSIDTKQIFEGALIPEVIKQRPKSIPYAIDWPLDLDIITDFNIAISYNNEFFDLSNMHLKLTNPSESGPIRFYIGNDDMEVIEIYELQITQEHYKIIAVKKSGITIRYRRNEYSLADFFEENPPCIKFVDQSILEGNYLVKINQGQLSLFNERRLEPWNWDGVDIRKESQGPSRDKESIQYRVIERLITAGRFSVIFDDDGAGEVADIVCIDDSNNKICIEMYHCKYSHGDDSGARVSDLYEVCGQAEKSIKWCQSPSSLIDRLFYREATRVKKGGTRFEVGSLNTLREIKNKLRAIPSSIEIFIVQPGIDSSKLTDGMRHILAGTSSYLMDTYSVDLKVICS